MRLKDISTPVPKKDHKDKVSGQLPYISDVKVDNMVYGVLYRSPIAYGKIKSIYVPTLPEGYDVVGAEDIPGPNYVKIIKQDQPIFANEWVNYIGEPILMLVGKDLNTLYGLRDKVKVEFEEHQPIYTLDEAIDQISSASFVSYEFGKGLDIISAIEQDAHQIVEEEYTTGYQEHVYLEPQGMLAVYKDDEIVVHGSMQALYYIKNALLSALACGDDEVRVVQSPTGGGFGGKEEFPSMMACHVAIAANAVKKSVMLVFDRHEDMVVTTKRHPAKFKYRTALDKEGNILSMCVDVFLDGGANEGLSSVVLQRSLLNSAGVYNIPHFHAKGHVLKTNTVPNGAFRGFGAPQSFAGIESHMGHLSKYAQLDPLEYKRKYLVKQGDPTITKGNFRDPILMEEMIEDLLDASDYNKKKEEFQRFNQQNLRYKKGIGTSVFLHGCGFTGSGERDHIKATVKLVKSKDGKVLLKISNSDMGQGIYTTLSKIVAKELDLPLEQVSYPDPDTKEVPDSGPTVASRTTMIVGKLLERAAKKLKAEWKSGEEQEVFEHYVHREMIPWDEKTFTGDAYPAYSWGVNFVEVEVDTLTGIVKLEKVYGNYEVGKAIDDRIMKGQIDGGLAQGLAYGYLEKMTTKQGKIQQKSISDYGPPTSLDVVPIESKLFDNPYADGPSGAKGAGELTLIGGAPAVQSAIEDALQTSFQQIPVTAEVIMESLERKLVNRVD
ncbi:xanthine dehydrogenase family protein molybdopterin-binding subunit [Neobacillus rhizophilus]|uniref:Xanthine dehydrogenase family protein n=1 Tax=Neobacillus rhizophilus TaxID=2833579 RepID=A0A942YXT2_9BACI|nr:xanthine dehydrogenase family protein molybdopterin-binding subunit [Neobacillus rhizophilus]MBS4214201.1 xanthine dehydrogenase family protein [Neobacillus rhizophilus]MBU8916008.1 xanthine dehydrogenase family protein molybdopterin-binding subunit [Bacillus sp. FJAT-29953]